MLRIAKKNSLRLFESIPCTYSGHIYLFEVGIKLLCLMTMGFVYVLEVKMGHIMCVCIYVCMYIYMYVYMYVRISVSKRCSTLSDT